MPRIAIATAAHTNESTPQCNHKHEMHSCGMTLYGLFDLFVASI